jgi:hypothetical protein
MFAFTVVCLQPQGPCLKSLTEEEAVEHLWSGPKAIARRALRGCVQALAPAAVSRSFASIQTDQELQKAGGWARRQAAALCSMGRGLPFAATFGFLPGSSRRSLCVPSHELAARTARPDLHWKKERKKRYALGRGLRKPAG